MGRSTVVLRNVSLLGRRLMAEQSLNLEESSRCLGKKKGNKFGTFGRVIITNACLFCSMAKLLILLGSLKNSGAATNFLVGMTRHDEDDAVAEEDKHESKGQNILFG